MAAVVVATVVVAAVVVAAVVVAAVVVAAVVNAAIVVAAAEVANVVAAVLYKLTPLRAPAEQLILTVTTTIVEDVATVNVDPAERSETTIIVDNFDKNVVVIVSILILEEARTAVELDKSAVIISTKTTTAFITVPEEVL